MCVVSRLSMEVSSMRSVCVLSGVCVRCVCNGVCMVTAVSLCELCQLWSVCLLSGVCLGESVHCGVLCVL